ncbi:MAG: TIGR02757 family protein [Bacteroidetes bacterium]|nr:MAG: TIGR02757 family protein [Bacteroidota bacterium]
MDNFSTIKNFLDQKFEQYNSPLFIASDPISIPHRYSLKEDREISGFLSATISWGQRKSIVQNAKRLMLLMDDAPYDFILHFRENDLLRFEGFVHRTFNYEDLSVFLYALKNIYQVHGGMEKVFSDGFRNGGIAHSVSYFRNIFFELPHEKRTRKHVSDPLSGSSAKRINMFLRWMVRNDNRGVDFGIWNRIRPDQLICPLDIHSGRVARKLGLLNRKQDDWKAAGELTENLRLLDSSDPVKYDFALFGLGVFEKF